MSFRSVPSCYIGILDFRRGLAPVTIVLLIAAWFRCGPRLDRRHSTGGTYACGLRFRRTADGAGRCNWHPREPRRHWLDERFAAVRTARSSSGYGRPLSAADTKGRDSRGASAHTQLAADYGKPKCSAVQMGRLPEKHDIHKGCSERVVLHGAIYKTERSFDRGPLSR